MTLKNCLYLLALPAVAAAQPLPALVDEALRNNREILAAQKKYEAARERPTQVNSLPDPMISLGYNSVGNPLPGAGLGSQVLANVGVMVSQEIPFPGKLKLKGEMASKEAQTEFQQYQAMQLAVISRLKQAYYRLQYTYAASDLLVRNRDLLEKLLKVTEDRYSVGRAAQQDVFKAQTQTSILETRLVKLEQERRSRSAEIDSILNREVGGTACRASRFADARPRSENDRTVGTGRQHGAQRILSRRHAQRGLLQHGVDDAHV